MPLISKSKLTTILYVHHRRFFCCPSCFEKIGVMVDVKPKIGDPLPTCRRCGTKASVERIQEV